MNAHSESRNSLFPATHLLVPVSITLSCVCHSQMRKDRSYFLFGVRLLWDWPLFHMLLVIFIYFSINYCLPFTFISPLFSSSITLDNSTSLRFYSLSIHCPNEIHPTPVLLPLSLSHQPDFHLHLTVKCFVKR